MYSPGLWLTADVGRLPGKALPPLLLKPASAPARILLGLAVDGRVACRGEAGRALQFLGTESGLPGICRRDRTAARFWLSPGLDCVPGQQQPKCFEHAETGHQQDNPTEHNLNLLHKHSLCVKLLAQLLITQPTLLAGKSSGDPGLPNCCCMPTGPPSSAGKN